MFRKVVRVLKFIPTVVGCLFICTFFVIALSPPSNITDKNSQSSIIRNIKSVENNKSTRNILVTPSSQPDKLVANSSIKVHTEKVVLYEHPFNYLHVPINVCTSSGAPTDPFLLVVVKSDVNHIAHRMAIRSTWGVTTKPGLKVVFLLGYSPIMKPFIQIESNMYKDIVQETFLDDYRNNTLKTIMGFNWVATHCAGAKYSFFVDDDYIVNIKYLWDHLHGIYEAGVRSIFLGSVWKDAKPERRENSKWFIPQSDFDKDTWPPYASGGSLVVTSDIIIKICNQFKLVKPIFIDDVYLGIVCDKLGITLTHEPRFYTHYRPDNMGYQFSSHGFRTPKTLLEDWEKYNKKLDMVV